MSFPIPSFIRRFRPKTHTGWIGVDLGSHSIKLAQVELIAGSVQLIEATAITLPPGTGFSAPSLESGWLAKLLLAELSLKGGFRGRKAACVLPMQCGDFRTMNLPPASSNETREMISQELADSGVGAADTLEFDFWNSSTANAEPDATATVNVLSVSRRVATMIAEQMLDAGLICQVLDGSPFAIARSVRLTADPISEPRVVAVVDWGATCAYFHILVDGQPLFTRVLKDCGVQRVVDAVRNGLQLTAEDCYELLATWGFGDSDEDVESLTEVRELVAELAAEPFNRLLIEIEKTISFLNHHRTELAPQAMWLVGGGTTIRNVMAKLSRAIGIPVRPWSLPRRTSPNRGVGDAPIELFAQAAALSQLGIEA